MTPRAWACFADTGNCIIWSTDEASVRSIADKHGRAVTPLCDLAEVTRATDLVADLVRELRHIEGISTGQVNRVAKQALAQLRDNAKVSGDGTASAGLPGYTSEVEET